MNSQVDWKSVGEESSQNICYWLTLVAGVGLCLWM